MSDDINKLTQNTVKLKYPFHHNGLEIDGFEFKQCKVRDRLAIAKIADEIGEGHNLLINAEFDIKCLAYLTGKDRSVIEEMDDRDFDLARERGALFMPKDMAQLLYQTPPQSQE